MVIPAEPTTYWCTGFKLPSEIITQKRYITQVRYTCKMPKLSHIGLAFSYLHDTAFTILVFLLSTSPPASSQPHLIFSHPLLLTLHVQISPKIDGMYVHHMQLYQCLSLNETTDLGMGYDCIKATKTIRSCRLGRPIIIAWAVGGNVRACKTNNDVF